MRTAADVDHFDVDAVLAENPLFRADPHDGDLFTEGAMGDAHQRQFCGGQMSYKHREE